MNYNRPELLDRLAAEYVLGLLRYRARARFQRLCAELPAALSARQRWEERLLPLSLALAPVAPDVNRWPQIERVIAALNGGGAVPRAARRSAARRWWPVAVAASLIGVALLVGRLTYWSEPTWQPIAVLAPANAAPLWRLERSADGAQINIRAVGPITLSAAKSYELWILPSGGGGNPVSLGLMPRQGNLERRLTPAQRALLAAARQVAVSVEPAGGSPTGQPTGPVVIVASVMRAS
jgi:anti-sigma-K factor RskA